MKTKLKRNFKVFINLSNKIAKNVTKFKTNLIFTVFFSYFVKNMFEKDVSSHVSSQNKISKIYLSF